MGFFSRLLGRKKDGIGEEPTKSPAEANTQAALQESSPASLPESTLPESTCAEDISETEEEAGGACNSALPEEEGSAPNKEVATTTSFNSPLHAPRNPRNPDGRPDGPDEGEDENDFLASLEAVERTPGHWLEVVLKGLDEVNFIFWQRMELLFEFLDTPKEEAMLFCAELEEWLGSMGFSRVDDFKSELQYRLAVAFDMEDEPEERERFLSKLWKGLSKTRKAISGSLGALFSGSGELDSAFWEELEEILISSDVGFEATSAIIAELKKLAKKTGCKMRQEARTLLQEEICKVFDLPLPAKVDQKPEVVLVVGVNGAGKTTTIAKMAYREHLAGKKVLLAAADTFRAAAIEQLEVWAKRIGAGFYSKPQGSDPAAVAFEALALAMEGGYDIVYIDTAGRLQTKANLMEELGKINRVLGKKMEGAPHRSILVLDGTTGQNALSQAKLFSESSPISEIAISKLDGTSRAGVAVGVAMNQKIPITFIGLGEKMEDLRPFEGRAFANALLKE